MSTAVPLAKAPSRMAGVTRFAKRNRIAALAAIVLVIVIVGAILAPVLTAFDPVKMSPATRLLGPGEGGLMGTDKFGRDVFTRILYGARISLVVGVVAVAIAAAIGTVIGLIAGYLGGWQEYITMRLMDVLFSFPSIVLAILIVSIVGSGFTSIIIAIALVQTPIFARIVRASTMAVKNIEYVHAAEAGGCHGQYDSAKACAAKCGCAHSGAAGFEHERRHHHGSRAELPGAGCRSSHPEPWLHAQ